MTRPPLTQGQKTARLTSELDPFSREVIRLLPQGSAGVFLRGAVAALVGALEAGEPVPAVEPGPAEPFAWKAPEDLIDRARAFVGPGKPYTHLSHLVRAAILKENRESCES